MLRLGGDHERLPARLTHVRGRVLGLLRQAFLARRGFRTSRVLTLLIFLLELDLFLVHLIKCVRPDQ